MAKTVIPEHIEGWFDKIRKNIIEFQENRQNMSKDEQIDFIRRQYVLLEIIISVLNDEMYFVGVNHDRIKNNQE